MLDRARESHPCGAGMGFLHHDVSSSEVPCAFSFSRTGTKRTPETFDTLEVSPCKTAIVSILFCFGQYQSCSLNPHHSFPA